MSLLAKGEINAFDFTMRTKPVQVIKFLHEVLEPFGTPFTLKKSSNMLLSNNREDAFIVLNTEGCFSVCHYPSHLHVTVNFAPSITGFIDCYSLYYNIEPRPRHYIHAETLCKGFTVPLDIFVEQCDKLNLWHDISKILAHRLIVLSAKNDSLVGNDAYSKIRHLLIELWLYPEDIRAQIKVTPFIQRRTNISRSRVMEVLQQLKKGNYIELKSGALFHMKKIPTAF